MIQLSEESLMASCGPAVLDEYHQLQSDAKQTLLALYKREEVISRLRSKQLSYEAKLSQQEYKTHFKVN